MAGSITITGTVSDVERKQGEFEGRPYDFDVAYLNVGKDMVQIRFERDSDVKAPAVDATITVNCSAPRGNRFPVRNYVETAGLRKAV